MIRALHTAATGMASQEANVNTISNNIANVNTTGYKTQRAEFEDLLYQTIKEAGSRSSGDSLHNVGLQIGSGSKVSATRKSFTSGQPMITNGPFDLMVEGQGLFGVIMPNGQLRFTRDGSFNVNAQGTIVNKSGLQLFPGISLPPNTQSVTVSSEGSVDAYIDGNPEPQNMGTIPVFTFINTPGLKATGGNLFRETASSGAPLQKPPGQDGAGTILQGALETSNVKIMDEMTRLISAQRAYEMNSKVMGVADQILQTTNNIR